jgi:hypothetical protein
MGTEKKVDGKKNHSLVQGAAAERAAAKLDGARAFVACAHCAWWLATLAIEDAEERASMQQELEADLERHLDHYHAGANALENLRAAPALTRGDLSMLPVPVETVQRKNDRLEILRNCERVAAIVRTYEHFESLSISRESVEVIGLFAAAVREHLEGAK